MKYLKHLSLFLILSFSQFTLAQENDEDTEKLLREAEKMIIDTDKILDKPDTFVPLDNSLNMPIIIFSITLALSIIYYIYLWKSGKRT
jgi:hypothetical protein